jgi:hypothetical protein
MTYRARAARGRATGARPGAAFMIVVDFSDIEEKSTTIMNQRRGRGVRDRFAACHR